MNALMIAFAFGLPYHVLRTAGAAGVRVHVLGNGASQALRTSLLCASYRTLPCPGTTDHEAQILAEIGRIVRRRKIDVIFPGDDLSCRLLAGMRDRLPVRTSLLPDLAMFDLLNHKWNFARYCNANGVRVPQAWCFDTRESLQAALRSGELDLPITVKPTNRSGSVGVLHIRDASERAQIDQIDYQPILVQRHIIGETVCISTVCHGGTILAHVTQRRDEHHFQLVSHPDLLANTERLIVASRLNGPANFDAVIEAATGLSYIVECNPRFWYTIHLSMILGFNFMTRALAEPRTRQEAMPDTMVSDTLELSLRHTLMHYRRANRFDRGLAHYNLFDPIPYLLCRMKWIDDSDVAVDVDQMNAYAWPEPAMTTVA